LWNKAIKYSAGDAYKSHILLRFFPCLPKPNRHNKKEKPIAFEHLEGLMRWAKLRTIKTEALFKIALVSYLNKLHFNNYVIKNSNLFQLAMHLQNEINSLNLCCLMQFLLLNFIYFPVHKASCFFFSYFPAKVFLLHFTLAHDFFLRRK